MIFRGGGRGRRGLDLPAVASVDEGCGSGAVAGEIVFHLREGVLGLSGLGPGGCSGEAVLEGDGGGVAGLTVVGRAGLDAGDGAMAVAEVPVAGLVGVGGPGGSALIAEVVVDLLLGDDDDLFLTGVAGEKALVDECGEGGVLIRIGSGYLRGKHLRLRPEARGVRGVPGVDGGLVIDGIVGGFLAAGGEQESGGGEGCRAEGLVKLGVGGGQEIHHFR